MAEGSRTCDILKLGSVVSSRFQDGYIYSDDSQLGHRLVFEKNEDNEVFTKFVPDHVAMSTRSESLEQWVVIKLFFLDLHAPFTPGYIARKINNQKEGNWI